MKYAKRQHGFTFIEIAITVAIVGMLATVVFPMTEMTVKRDQEHELRVALREIRNALDAYKQASDEGRITISNNQTGYPPQLKVLTEGVTDEKSPDRNVKIYFLRHMPRDPMNPDLSKPNDETWGKRSYASSQDAPEEGEDVFDVYSLVTDVGLNGVPYKDW